MTLPEIEPLVPVLRKQAPRGREWRYELKLDGFRAVFAFDGETALFRSKTRRRMQRFRDLADRLAGQTRASSLILDGELVVMGEQGPDFYALMAARAEPQYAAFDLLWVNGRDLRGEAYSKRKAALKRFLDRDPAPISFVESHRSPGLLEAATRLDLEGIVAKRVADPYGEGVTWVKVKNAAYSQAEGRADLFHR